MLRAHALIRWPALVLLAGAACQNAVGQFQFVNDTFDVGEMTPADDPSDPLDAAWDKGSVVDDAAGIGAGNVLEYTDDNVGEFQPFDLLNLGDSATLSWDFRFVGSSIGGSGDVTNGNFGYRVYLTDTPQRSTGYGIRIGTGGDGLEGNQGNGIGLRQGNNRAGPYNTPDGDMFDGVPTQNGAFTVNDNDPHAVSLTMTRTMVETEINGVSTGQVEGIMLEGMVDNISVSGVFPFGFEEQIAVAPLNPLRYIYFDDNGVGVDYLMDNVIVQTNTGPPPGPGDVDGNGVVDINDFAPIRANLFDAVVLRSEGDLNGDGLVDFVDFREWKVNRTVGAAVGVPEPAGALLAIMVAAGLAGPLIRRRRSPGPAGTGFLLSLSGLRLEGIRRNWTTCLCWLGASLAAASAVAQNDVIWDNAGVGDWSEEGNWNGGFVPQANPFNEAAVINNGGTAQVSDAPPEVAELSVGPGMVEILSGGSLIVMPFQQGNGSTNITSNGTLFVASGGEFSGESLSANGNLRLGSSATANVAGNVNLAGTLEVEFDGLNFNPIAAGSVNVGGALHMTPSVAPSVGDSWDLVDATSVNGGFASISSTLALPPGSEFQTSVVPGGNNGMLLRLRLDQFLVLSVNRATGAVGIGNIEGGLPIEIDGYSIRSASASLDDGAWNSLEDQALGGFLEANPSAAKIGELNPDGAATLQGGTVLELGNVYQPTPSQFGQGVEDLVFQYTSPDGSISDGRVEYHGYGVNNLVLQIDPTSGAGFLVNESPFSVDVDGYSIASEQGGLVSETWNSFEDQGEGDWREAPNSDANRLSELNPDGTTTFPPDARFSLGEIFHVGAEQDLMFEFGLPGEFQGRLGEVIYELRMPTVVEGTGDYNDDGVINAADYVVWRNNLGQLISLPGEGVTPGEVTPEDYDFWKSQFGAGGGNATAIPEPYSLGLVMVGLLTLCHRRIAVGSSVQC